MRRLSLGLRQVDVARLAGLSREQIGKLELGHVTDPHHSTVTALAAALRCQPAEIFPLNDGGPVATPGLVRTSPGQGRHEGL